MFFASNFWKVIKTCNCFEKFFAQINLTILQKKLYYKNMSIIIKIIMKTLFEILGFKRYDDEGYDRDGYDRDGYNRGGYNHYGYDRNGYDRDGYVWDSLFPFD